MYPQTTCHMKTRDTQQEDGQVMMGTETGAMRLQAQTCQGLPATPEAKRRAWDRLSSTGFSESGPCQHRHFRLLGPETARDYFSAVLNHSVWGTCLRQSYVTHKSPSCLSQPCCSPPGVPVGRQRRNEVCGDPHLQSRIRKHELRNANNNQYSL